MKNFYEIKITGKDTKRFIRTLHRMKIQLYKIEYQDNSVIIWIDRENFSELKKIKTIYKIELINYHGVLKIEYLLKKYSLFILMMGIGILLILLLSKMIFSVEVIHVKKEYRDFIKEELKKEGIDLFHFQKTFDKQEQIVKKITTTYRDKIEWLEIERIGTKYIAKVEERKYSNVKDDETPRDIIAKKDGRILEIEASTGTVIAKKDQYVKKGDVLISGQIKNKDILMAEVKAEGKVKALTWYTVNVSLPYYYQEEKATGEKRKALNIQILSKKWNFSNGKKFSNKKTLPIFEIKNPLIPISISLCEEEKIDKTEKLYTRDLASIEASRIAREKLKQKLGNDIEILYEKSLKITEENSKIDIEIFFTLKEDITAYQEIPEEIEEES